MYNINNNEKIKKKNDQESDLRKKIPELRINPGTASILLIFVTLCLVSFSVLSLVSANSDKKLNDKVLTRTTEYYEACNLAQHVLAHVDDELLATYENSGSEEEYFSSVGTSRSFVVTVSETQRLNISIEILYPQSEDDAFYKITGWDISDITLF